MYRVGFPGWKFAARAGLTLQVRVEVHYDPEVKSYWTSSPDLKGLVVTANTLDDLMRETKSGIDDLMEFELAGVSIAAKPQLTFSNEALCAA